MKGVNHGNRLKPCSRTSGAGERFPASEPGEAKHRAVARANPCTKPRNANLRAASVSDCMKPALSQQPTARLRQALRGDEGQRDAKEELGTWDHPHDACGVSRRQQWRQRSNKLTPGRGEVGEAHSSDESGESRRSEGALATDTLTQKLEGLIGPKSPVTDQATRVAETLRAESEAGLLSQAGHCESLMEETSVGTSRAVAALRAKAGCGKSARPV